jgi:hypothetical protein
MPAATILARSSWNGVHHLGFPSYVSTLYPSHSALGVQNQLQNIHIWQLLSCSSLSRFTSNIAHYGFISIECESARLLVDRITHNNLRSLEADGFDYVRNFRIRCCRV